MKTVLVTGVAHGIGKAIAAKLSEKYCVIGVDKELPEHIFCDTFYQCDLSNMQELQETIIQVKNRCESLYALVNNAGIFIHKPLQDQSILEWEKIIAVNLTAPYVLSQALSPLLYHGHIINIASTRAYMSEAGTEPYSASKGGIVALTHALSISLSGSVSVNSISPGWINTDESYVATVEEKAWHASGRVGKPHDIAKVVEFLLEDEDGFITGSDFVVDGGVSKKMVYP